MNRITAWYYRQVKSLIIKKPLFNQNSEVPFFILSSGRSGSTLLRKLLLQNTSVNIPPESDDLIPKLIKFYLRYNHCSWEFIAEKTVEIFNQETKPTFWNSKIEDYNKLFSAKNTDRSLAGLVQHLYKEYSEVRGLESERWGDKTPFLIFRLSWINILYPSAQFIYLIRDGRAVVNSFLKLDKNYDVEMAANRWLKSLNAYEKQMQLKGSKNILFIRYEDLVNSTEIELEKICSFLKLKMERNSDARLYLGDDILPHHINIHKNVTNTFISKWETELSLEEKELTIKIIGKKLMQYGYC